MRFNPELLIQIAFLCFGFINNILTEWKTSAAVENQNKTKRKDQTKMAEIPVDDILLFYRVEKNTFQQFSHDLVEKELMNDYPPRYASDIKRQIFQMLPEIEANNIITYSRWKSMSRSIFDNPFLAFESVEPIRITPTVSNFNYCSSPEPQSKTWYVNFAGHVLASTYSGPQMGVDEIQCTEHPALCSINEKYSSERSTGCLLLHEYEGAGDGTPCLIQNVQRRVDISRLNKDNVRSGNLSEIVTVYDPFWYKTTNFIAMEAPSQGHDYTNPEFLKQIYTNAYTGFRAAVVSSNTEEKDSKKVVMKKVIIHTGHWGCGDYRGNRYFMAVLQIRAAMEANVWEIVYHTYDQAGQALLERIVDQEKFLFEPSYKLQDLFEYLSQKKLSETL